MYEELDITKVEFFQEPRGEIIVKPIDSQGFILDEKKRDFIIPMKIMLENDYPTALKACQEWNKKSRANTMYFEFLNVRRFCKCNFAKYDGILDIDSLGVIHFEYVECPLRGECKYENVICNPSFNTSLTKNDINLLRMIVIDQMTAEQISMRIGRSINTINNRRKSIQYKTECNTIAKLVAYWYKHQLV